MTWPKFLLGYCVLLLGTVGIALWADGRFAVDGERVLLFEGAVLFLLAAAGWPRLLYQIVRNTGWFAAIESDRAMRTVLVILGLGLAIAGAVHG